MTSFLQDLVKAKFLLKRAQTLIDAGLENVILITVFCLDLVQVDLRFCPFKPEAGAFIQECEKDLLEMILLSRNFAVIFVFPLPLLFSPPFLSIPSSLFQLLPTEFVPSSPFVSATQVKSVPGLHICCSYLRFKSCKIENVL